MTQSPVTPSTVERSPGGAALRMAGTPAEPLPPHPGEHHRHRCAAPAADESLISRFSIDPVPPFRLDLTVWALRRRPANIVDRWDGDTYHRTVDVGGTVAEVAVRQTGPSD